MAEIEITGKQIGQLDPLEVIDGSEKIPVETADGNGHVTTQQMREYAQPDLSGYAKKEDVADKADAPLEFREPYEALRIRKQPDLVIEGYFGCSKSTADLLIIQFSNDTANIKTKWRRMTEFIPADEFQFTLRDDGTYLYIKKNYGGGVTTLHVMTRGAEPLEAITIKSAEIPAEATDVAEAPSYEDFITEAEADGKYATKEEIPSVEGLLSESKAAETYQPIGDYATKEEIEDIGGVGAKGTGTNAEVFNDYTGNKATGSYSHAEGSGTEASGLTSHAEGLNTTASRSGSHAEGSGTVASGGDSHAEGLKTRATEDRAHAEGENTKASGIASHAEGCSTEATNSYEHAEGMYNKSNRSTTDAGKTRHSVGIGTSGSDRKNAFEIMANGDAYLYGVGGYDGTNALAEEAKTLQEVVGGIPDTSQLATKEELGQAVAGKVGGTGVSAIEVVTELPAEPQDGVMYVVMG